MIFASETSLVKDILSTDYICLDKKNTLEEVIEAMLINNLTEVFIVDELAKLRGIITLSDIARLKRAKVPLKTPIKEIMTKNVISVGKEYTVVDCKELLRRHHIKRLPVIENNILYGVIRYKEIEYYYYEDVEKAFASYDLLLNNMHEAVHVVDRNGKFILWNKAAEELYELKESDVLGKHMAEFFDDEMFHRIKKDLINIENFYHSPKKGCHVVTNAHPIIINGKLLGIISTDRDITEVEILTKELNRIKHKLQIMNTPEERDSFVSIRGESSKLIRAINIAKQVAKTQATIMITGESGTGKEVFAKSIFNESYNEKNNIFVPVNCSAIPRELFESEFFGYESGAFTGASKKGKTGLFELANNGTIFLDEIGDLPLFMQAKLLRVLQENTIKRVGSTKEINVKTRVISATNKDLLKMVEKGEFREDLYYRLNVIELKLPPLRERLEDIKPLSMKFIKDLSLRNHKQVQHISDDVIEMLQSYKWKGNIRELKNTIEYMVVLCRGNLITEEVVPGYIKRGDQENIISMSTHDGQIVHEIMHKKSEKEKMIEALQETNGNKTKAAKRLKMARSSFYYKLNTYGLR